jgi:hypothetical protein
MAPNDLSEVIRKRLNGLKEKNEDGTYYKAGWQFITLVVGNIAESSTNPKIRRLGKMVSLGAKKSIADYASQKISEFIMRFLSDV